MVSFFLKLIFAQWILSGRWSCLICWSFQVEVLTNRKWNRYLSCILATAFLPLFFFFFLCKQKLFYTTPDFIQNSVRGDQFMLCQSHITTLLMEILKYWKPLFLQCLPLSNFNLTSLRCMLNISVSWDVFNVLWAAPWMKKIKTVPPHPPVLRDLFIQFQ